MRNLILFALSSFLLFSSTAAQQQQQFSALQEAAAPKASNEISPQLRKKILDAVWRTVNEKYFDRNFGGVDWNKVRARYAPLVEAAGTDEEFYDLLNKMLYGELHVSHLGVAPAEDIESQSEPPGNVGIDFRALGGAIVITGVDPKSAASEAGLRPGFILKEIDGRAVEGQKLDASRYSLTGAPGTKVRLSYLDEQDRPHEVELVRRASYTDMDRVAGLTTYAEFESRRLPSGIGYIRFSDFIASLKKKMRAAILSMSDAPGLIIDLRGNGGGDDALGLTLANLLFSKRTLLMITKTRKGDDDYYHATPEKRAYSGPVVILQDELSGSASEQFAAGMQESGRAFVIGLKSAGDDMDADLKKLPGGAYLIYPYGQPRTPKGVVIEGRGVIPDFEVKLTRAELLKGIDSQLNAAIEYIQRQAR